MPTLLRELLDEANIHTNGAVPSQQIKEKYTMIEDVTMPFANPALKTNYTSLMGPNNIMEPQAPSKMRLPTSPPQSYQMNNQNNFSPNLNVRSLTEEERIMSLNAAQNNFMNSASPMAGLLAAPQSAGISPPMKQFATQPSMPMRVREGFRSRQQGQQSCIDTLNHISSCPMCSRYFECDAKVYHVIIFMLIVLFLTILYFVCKEEHKFGK
jgi:hypothetical protein